MALSNAADKAKEKQAASQMEREKLNGNKKVANQEFDDEKAAYTLMVCISPALSMFLRFCSFFSSRRLCEFFQYFDVLFLLHRGLVRLRRVRCDALSSDQRRHYLWS